MRSIDDLIIDVLLVVVVGVGSWYGAHHYGAVRYQAGYDAAVAGRAAADNKAVLARMQGNAAIAVKQAESNATITEKKHEELTPVRERIITQRVYVGSALCGERPAAPAQGESAASSDGTNPPGRLVRPDVERDIVALKLAVEEDLATGRTCQATLRANGMAP